MSEQDLVGSEEFNRGELNSQTQKLLKKLKKVGLEFVWRPSEYLPGVGIDYEIKDSPEKGWASNEPAFQSRLENYYELRESYLEFKRTGNFSTAVVKTQRYDKNGKPIGREK